MAYQSHFRRYEIKYLLTQEEKARVLAAMEPYMVLDQYGRTTVRNLYYDTDNYRLIRRSLEKPVYKEKLRLRSYTQAQPDSPVFVELKKKYNGVVYKRRIRLPEQTATAWLDRGVHWEKTGQIVQEIDYFLDYYGSLRPRVFLAYDREAYYCRDGSDFRVTFDDRILCRRDRLSLCCEPDGISLLAPGQVLMEVKTAGGIPLWMCRVLTREGIRKTSFSKYGKAYETMIFTGGYDYAGNNFSGTV